MDTFKYAKETFDELYGRLSMPVILFDEKARLIKANQSFLDLTKASPDDLQTHSMISFFKGLKTPFDQGTILKVIPEYIEIELTDIDGNSTSVGLIHTKLKKGDGPYETGLGFINDLRKMNLAQEKIKELTLENEAYKEQLSGKKLDKVLDEKVRLEKDLLEIKALLDNLLESCGDGIYTLGSDGRINLVNKSFAAMLGKKKEEIVGTFPYELGPWEGKFRSTTGEMIALDQSYYDYQTRQIDKRQELRDGDGGKIENWELYALHKNGDIVPLELTVSIRKNTEGDFAGSVTTARDLTKKKIVEKEIEESRDFLERVIETMGDGLAISDEKGQILSVNTALERMSGYKKDVIIGQHISMFTLKEDKVMRKKILEKIPELFEKGSAFYETDFKRKDGALVEVECNSSLIKDKNGNYIAGVAVFRNISDRKKLAKEVKESRDFLEKVIETSYDGIVVGNTSGTILLANTAAARITGRSKEEIVGKHFHDVIGIKSIPQEVSRKRMTNLHNKEQISFETSFRNKDGRLVYLEHGISLIEDIKAEPALIVSIIRDITEKKKAEKSLQEAYQFRSQFFTNITHAFRTPLTLAIGPIEGILRGEFGNVSKNIIEQLSLTLRNNRQLLKLINQLLDFSMLESGKRKVIYEKKHLKQFISAVLDSFSFVAKKKKIKLTFTPGRNIPYMYIDPVKTEKILFNLIGNAFKFTPEKGSITVTIENVGSYQGKSNQDEIEITDNDSPTLPTDPKCDYVKISVIDTGIGIKEDDLKQIFDRFKQAGGSYSPEHGGAGIGLAHAKELVELMGGRITVKSEYGKGSQFSIYLPVKRGPVDQGKEVAEGTQDELFLQPEIELSDIHLGKDVVAERISGKKPLVLVIDDNPDVRHYISDIIKKEYDFITAQNGPEGLKKLEQHKPDVILCDIMMPEMDGHEFLKRVRSNPSLLDIPFIFLTARADTEMKIESLEEGADDYIVKPFNSLELLARVKSLLRIRTLTSKATSQEKKISNLTQKLLGKYCYGNIIGNSPLMRKIYQLLETIKDSDSTILITGETGTGKELIANAIHYSSPRKSCPIISVNCGAIPKELMEREFFGHIKGAYTGAIETQKGYFAEADGGTLFLDEIGEMGKDIQVKLLRVLERGEFAQVGDSTTTKTDVRLIASTNKDLRTEVRKGNFREDLYYRIHVIPIHLPPLKQRSEDIPLLIEHFLKKYQSKLKTEILPLSEEEMSLFMNYSYPGNVRELEHIIERFCLLGSNAKNLFKDLLDVPGNLSSDFPYDEFLSSTNPLKTVGQKAKVRAEREAIMHVLKICNNDYNEAAKILNIGLSSLYRKLKEHGGASL